MTQNDDRQFAGRAEQGQPTYRLGRWILREDWPLWIVLAGAFVAAALIYPSLPDRIPTHWNIRGEVDRWSGKFGGVFGMWALNLGIYLMMLLAPLVDPKRENYAKFHSTYRVLRTVLVLLMTSIWGTALAAADGVPVNVGLVVPVAVSVLFILLGNLMGRLRYNWFVGIKTPWSLSSEEAWRRTHRAAGPAWVIGGLISLVSAFLGPVAAAWGMGLGIGGASIFSLAYSYVAWRQTGGKPQ